MIENVELPGMPPRDQQIIVAQVEQIMDALFAGQLMIQNAITSALEGEYSKAESRLKMARSQFAAASTGLAKLTDGE